MRSASRIGIAGTALLALLAGAAEVRAVNITNPGAPYDTDASTKLLLHIDEAPGSALIDSSGAGNSAVKSGDLNQTTSLFRHGPGSAVLDGAGDYINIASSTDFQFGTNDFTVDFWMRTDAITGLTQQKIGLWGSGLDANSYTIVDWFSSEAGADQNMLVWQNRRNGGTVDFFSRSWLPQASTWYHLAFVRASGVFHMYVDGAELGTGNTLSMNIDWYQDMRFGRDGINTGYLDGNLDEVRVSKGVARWTGNFSIVPEPASVALALATPALLAAGGLRRRRRGA